MRHAKPGTIRIVARYARRDEPLRDLSEDRLPEDGPKTKVFPDAIVVFRRRDGRFDWHRVDQNLGDIVYGSNQRYADASQAVERAHVYHPDLTIDLSGIEGAG